MTNNRTSARLQLESQAAARAIATTDSALGPCIDRYYDFCTALNLPLFPIPASILALFIFAKCSFRNSYYDTPTRRMKRVKRETDDIWAEVEDYKDMRQEDDEILEALRQFLLERKDVRVKPRGAYSLLPHWIR